MDSPQTIGIFGGTFDPVHIGHLLLAKDLVDALALDRLYLVPNQVSPFKLGEARTSAHHRVAMLHLAVEGEERLAVSDVEVRRPPPSYTVDTLRHFREVHPAARRFFILGADNLRDLHHWREIESLFDLAEFRVLARPGFDLRAVDPDSLRLPPGRAAELLRTALQTRLVPVSSTRIRSLAAERKSLNDLVPDAVADYISQNHLYQG